MDSNQIKLNNPIERVISRYLTLSIKGNKAIGRCPFHPDRSPSLHVHMEKQIFTCFACGEKGDVIAFVQKIEKCSFVEAIQKLSPVSELDPGTQKNSPSQQRKEEKAGVDATPHRVRGQAGSHETSQQTRGQVGVSLPVNPEHEVFLKTLMPYVSGHRELSPVYLDFEVGVAPSFGHHPLRGRIVFPIRDEEGMLRGFSGRLADSCAAPGQARGPRGASPKYLNTSVKDGLEKGRILYGYWKARKAIEESGVMYLTEGYKDAIAMHAAGFTGTVALGGIALTHYQLELIQRNAEKVYLVLDGDERGQEGAAKIEKTLLAHSIETVSILLPESHDPDSYFREVGRDVFKDFMMEKSFPPSSDENLLLTACLLYPHTMMLCQGEKYPFIELLPGILEKDNILLPSKAHRDLLNELLVCPEEAKKLRVAMDLMETYGEEIRQIKAEWLLIKRGNEKEALTGMMEYLLFQYSAERLTHQITTLVRTFRRVKSLEHRHVLLKEIQNRKDLMECVSHYLGLSPLS